MSTIHPTAVVDGAAELGADVAIGPCSVIGPRVRLGDGTEVMAHAVIDGRTTLGAGCRVFPFAAIGLQCQDLKFKGEEASVEIGDRTVLREYVTVNAGTEEERVTRIGSDTFLMAYSHVAHGCNVGNRVIMANATMLGGLVTIEDRAVVSALVGIHQYTRVGTMCMVGGLSRISQDCPPYMMVVGSPPAVHGLNAVGLKRNNVDEKARRALKEAYRILYREGLAVPDALARIRAELEPCAELEHLVEFVASSERGITR
ncbi:MAG: acyl-ACP--UDP-N-acetylglucosamine O-acyltransferase [Lentisphaerae bacterium]|nr:acyl-ACP--UDP-N-acetylglucosamine O-acyltransferase [Lentisphaerota bacterium]